jgi:hypothetical protein
MAAVFDETISYYVDASTFQEPLVKLAEVLAQKLRREAAQRLAPTPSFVAVDLHVLMRQVMYTYNCLFYLNADETRKNDPHWRLEYSVATLPLIRNMIDCFYNITAILEDPRVNGPWFRKSGYRKALEGFDEEEKRYGGRPEWDEWIKKGRDGLDFQIRGVDLVKSDVLTTQPWPTLGKYVSDKRPGGVTTPHQDFLKMFLYGRWREYSAMAHGGFEGLLRAGMFYIRDSAPHEDRPKIEDAHERVFSSHIGRAALVLLCIITELQAYFRFDDDGARISERIHSMWKALMVIPEVKEVYDLRYEQLMKDKGINS